MNDIEKILLTAIAIERYGQEFYKSFAMLVDDKKGKALMNGLAKDEKEHESVLSTQYETHFHSNPPQKIDIDLGLKAIRHIFGNKKNLDKEKEVTLEILQVGIVVEDESIKYYSSKAKKTSEKELSQLLNNLAKIETEHKEMLEENLFHLRQEGAWWGYVPILEG
ncbi:MAG: ferritin family protein [Thermoplasmata archaeon]|nr:ferritin family protein [Thermoplasmata archaeon]